MIFSIQMNDECGTNPNVELCAYSSQSDALDSAEDSIPIRPLRVGPDARKDSIDPEEDSTARDRTLRKGPFIYRE